MREQRSCRPAAWACEIGLVLAWSLAGADPPPEARPSTFAAQADAPAIEALLDLGSEFSSLDAAQKKRVLVLIDNRGRRLDLERDIVTALDRADPESPYDTLAAAQGRGEADDLEAAYHSFARYVAAEQALDAESAARQLRAFQQYLALAADAIEMGLKGDDETLRQMSGRPALRRRGPAEQAAFVASLRSSGLPAKSLEVLRARGATDAQQAEYLRRLLAMKPEEIGTSADDFLAAIDEARRKLVEYLRALATANPAAMAGPTYQTFLVGNPGNREGRVTLRIRRASVPPTWKIAIVNAAEPDEAKPAYRVTESEPGRTYTLQLPAHGQARVAAVVTPVGNVAEGTTASWAVEGTIDGVLIGGMLMEMHVPASVPPVRLPPIEPAAGPPTPPIEQRERTVAGANRHRASPAGISVYVGAGALLVVLLPLVLFIRRRMNRGAARRR